MTLFEKDTKEYKELDRRIKCIQFYQQECIDSVKNGEPPKPIPKYWYDYNCNDLKYKTDKETGEILNTQEEIEWIDFNKKLLTEKKPYYFIYIYEDLLKQYKTFSKKINQNCARRFRCEVEDLKPNTKEKEDFLKWYNKKNLISNNPCIINKISKIVENEFPRKPRVSETNFKYEFYLDKNKEYQLGSNSEIKKIKKIYIEYKKMMKQLVSYQCIDKEKTLSEKKDRFVDFKQSLIEIIPNEDILLNTLLFLSYKRNYIGKTLVWSVMGEKIIENLLKNNFNTITYPTKSSEGDIWYGGYKFKEVKKIII